MFGTQMQKREVLYNSSPRLLCHPMAALPDKLGPLDVRDVGSFVAFGQSGAFWLHWIHINQSESLNAGIHVDESLWKLSKYKKLIISSRWNLQKKID